MSQKPQKTRSALRASWIKPLICLCLALFSSAALPQNAQAEKLRDLCDIVGARENQLVGYGVVTGLNGTGDDVSAPFAAQSIRSLLKRLGIQVNQRQLRLRNIAAVVVTASLPPFARSGSKLDVTVSSLGNARSLQGGILIQTPLRGADRRTYAVGQGPLVLGGFSAGGSGGSVQENITTVARVPNGALIERSIPTVFFNKNAVELALRLPDFGTAQKISAALNEHFGSGSAKATDAGTIVVTAPASLRGQPVALVAQLGELEVEPVQVATVVINERTGTIVAGGDVRLAPVAIAQGGITIAVTETTQISQPNALAGGETKAVKNTTVETEEKSPPPLTYLKGAATLADVAQALSTFGITPRELASILQALKAAGALRAAIIIQ